MITTAHIGPIDPERQACIDRMREVYGAEFVLKTDYPVMTPEQARVFMDGERLNMIRHGGGYGDSDMWPNEKWQPTEDGLWVCHGWGRLDYWALWNRNADELVEEAIKYGEGKGFGWPLKWLIQNEGRIKKIPMGMFNHKYLTTSQKENAI